MKALPLLFSVITLFLAWGGVSASPFLTADPQCNFNFAQQAECPVGYQFSEDDGTTWVELNSSFTDTDVVIWHDLGVYAPGPHSFLVRGMNPWGVSDEVPFDFGAGQPVAPGGLRIVAPPSE